MFPPDEHPYRTEERAPDSIGLSPTNAQRTDSSVASEQYTNDATFRINEANATVALLHWSSSRLVRSTRNTLESPLPV